MPRTRHQIKSQGSENDVTVSGQAQVKRMALESTSPNQQKPSKLQKRERAFGDITNAISSFAIDSGKKSKKVDVKAKPKLASVSEAVDHFLVESRSSSLPSLTKLKEEVKSEEEDSKVGVKEDSDSSSSASSAATSLDNTPVHIAKKEDPCPLYDFDAENEGDIYNCPSFARDIFVYYRLREPKFMTTDYLPRQNGITKSMRMILVDWMVEIQENFELNHETLYLAVKLTDRYLDLTDQTVSKEQLQLVGSTALFIASKFDERQPPCLDDFLYICDDAYTKGELLALEMQLLQTIGHDLAMPLSYRFLRRYAKAGKLSMEVLTLARYILESSLMHYEFVLEAESHKAAAALLLALRMNKAPTLWTAELEKYSGYVEADVVDLMWRLNHMLLTPDPKSIKTIFEKYSHEVFHCVAKVEALPPGL